jgi:hypothetical protein
MEQALFPTVAFGGEEKSFIDSYRMIVDIHHTFVAGNVKRTVNCLSEPAIFLVSGVRPKFKEVLIHFSTDIGTNHALAFLD